MMKYMKMTKYIKGQLARGAAVGVQDDYRLDRVKGSHTKMADPPNIGDDAVEFVQHIDPEDVANIVNDVFEDMDVDVEDEESSDEERALSADSGYNSDHSSGRMNRYMKLVSRAEILALNDTTKHCKIEFYYTTGDALAVCVNCKIRLVNVELGPAL